MLLPLIMMGLLLAFVACACVYGCASVLCVCKTLLVTGGHGRFRTCFSPHYCAIIKHAAGTTQHLVRVLASPKWRRGIEQHEPRKEERERESLQNEKKKKRGNKKKNKTRIMGEPQVWWCTILCIATRS